HGQLPGASTATTITTVIPPQLRFRSWHVDRGGALGVDNKTIAIETADGETVVLLDCRAGAAGVNNDLPPCQMRASVRDADDFDDVAIPTGAAGGRLGRIVFGYDRGAASDGYEQGWFIDDLNAVRCP